MSGHYNKVTQLASRVSHRDVSDHSNSPRTNRLRLLDRPDPAVKPLSGRSFIRLPDRSVGIAGIPSPGTKICWSDLRSTSSALPAAKLQQQPAATDTECANVVAPIGGVVLDVT